MRIAEFYKFIGQHSSPVILLEGIRALPAAKYKELVSLGEMLAKNLPDTKFRTGNATGSDEAFAEGVAKVHPGRLEYILPYSGHRKKMIFPQAICHALNTVSDSVSGGERMENLFKNTLIASPAYRDLLSKGKNIPKLKAKINYLLRDTMKVVGINGEIPGATAGIFFADIADPMKGGTGHTIRVCRGNSIPVILQNDWKQWLS